MEKLYGLLGEKLTHSYSPIIHNIIFKNIDTKAQYHLFEIERNNIKNVISGLKTLNISGVNVTIPYKIEIMDYLDSVSSEGEKIGAVNTICINNNRAVGYNTDYYGFGMMLNKSQVDVCDKKAIILGTGGAAQAVVHYLLDNGIREVAVVSRDNKKNKFMKDIDIINYEQLKKIKNNDILINCTPVGMSPKINESPISKNEVAISEVVVDLIYNPKETLILKYARELQLKGINGLYMLVAQAVKAEELWNDITISSDVIDNIYDEVSSYLK
ncbi:shikimate dehydrogenase [Clostridium lundense]|uniref:shikimate dehydrogenase n=1 Tax=Clostridium lundense TaxID=319475 RepID=UPI000483CD6E|nr:shikimate dehydrogenase [Clostridium lundense]